MIEELHLRRRRRRTFVSQSMRFTELGEATVRVMSTIRPEKDPETTQHGLVLLTVPQILRNPCRGSHPDPEINTRNQMGELQYIK